MKYTEEGFGFSDNPRCPNDGKRHVNPLSWRFKDIKELKQEIAESGGIWHGKEDWTNEQTDILLNCFFIHVTGDAKLVASKPLCLSCGRSFDAIGTKLRKLAIRYLEDSTVSYEPIKRFDRTGTKFVLADYAFMERASDLRCKGIANGANNRIWLAKLLARSINDIKQEQLRLCLQEEKRGFGMWCRKNESDEEKIIRLVHQALLGAFNDMMDSL